MEHQPSTGSGEDNGRASPGRRQPGAGPQFARQAPEAARRSGEGARNALPGLPGRALDNRKLTPEAAGAGFDAQQQFREFIRWHKL
jgi:hypothetical protein